MCWCEKSVEKKRNCTGGRPRCSVAVSVPYSLQRSGLLFTAPASREKKKKRRNSKLQNDLLPAGLGGSRKHAREKKIDCATSVKETLLGIHQKISNSSQNWRVRRGRKSLLGLPL